MGASWRRLVVVSARRCRGSAIVSPPLERTARAPRSATPPSGSGRLRAAVAWSHDLLDELVCLLFGRMGPCSSEAAGWRSCGGCVGPPPTCWEDPLELVWKRAPYRLEPGGMAFLTVLAVSALRCRDDPGRSPPVEAPRKLTKDRATRPRFSFALPWPLPHAGAVPRAKSLAEVVPWFPGWPANR